MNPKLKLRWLKRKKVLTDSLITDIESADNENAVELLFEHLRLHADVATLWKYCKMVITADAYPKMQELGKKMLSELPPEGLLWRSLVLCWCVCVCVCCAGVCVRVCVCVCVCVCVFVSIIMVLSSSYNLYQEFGTSTTPFRPSLYGSKWPSFWEE